MHKVTSYIFLDQQHYLLYLLVVPKRSLRTGASAAAQSDIAEIWAQVVWYTDIPNAIGIRAMLILLSRATDHRIIRVDMHFTTRMLEIKELRRDSWNRVVLVRDVRQCGPKLGIYEISPILVPAAWEDEHGRGHLN